MLKQEPFRQENRMANNSFNQQKPQLRQPNQKNEPPIVIPLLLIFSLSSIFILCFLKHIGKEYLLPLKSIQDKNMQNNMQRKMVFQ